MNGLWLYLIDVLQAINLLVLFCTLVSVVLLVFLVQSYYDTNKDDGENLLKYIRYNVIVLVTLVLLVIFLPSHITMKVIMEESTTPCVCDTTEHNAHKGY